MLYCSNCGQQLTADAKFCANCGAPVQAGGASTTAPSAESDRERQRREDFQNAWGGSGPRQQPEPDAFTPAPTADDDSSADGFASRPASWETERANLREQTQDEWSMTDLGPARPQRRRTWLWVLLGIIAFIVLACCVFGWWITATDSGTEWFEGIATQAAEEMQRATEQAATPEP